MAHILTAIDMAIGRNATVEDILEIAAAIKEHEAVIDPVIDDDTKVVHAIIISELDHFTVMQKLKKTGKVYSSVVAAKGIAETIGHRLDLYYSNNCLNYLPFHFSGTPEVIFVS